MYIFLYSNLVYFFFFFFIIYIQHYSELFYIKYHKIICASHGQLTSYHLIAHQDPNLSPSALRTEHYSSEKFTAVHHPHRDPIPPQDWNVKRLLTPLTA